jgi:hypothetical protein
MQLRSWSWEKDMRIHAYANVLVDIRYLSLLLSKSIVMIIHIVSVQSIMSFFAVTSRIFDRVLSELNGLSQKLVDRYTVFDIRERYRLQMSNESFDSAVLWHRLRGKFNCENSLVYT